jgi:CRP-like cAMP-binding protein
VGKANGRANANGSAATNGHGSAATNGNGGAATNGANRLLACLAPDDYADMLSALEPVDLPSRRVLHARDERIDYVYFPETAVCSIIAVMESGDAAESGTVGRDGFVGVPVALGVESAPFDTIVQVAGRALRMTTTKFREHLEASPSMRGLIERHIQALLVQSFQSTACNRLHPLLQRCCRWLLLTHDRVGSSELRITHDLLAVMVGVRRPSVTLAVQQLERLGLVTYKRGRFVILDRPGLEEQCCECYAVVQEHLVRLFAPCEPRPSASGQT